MRSKIALLAFLGTACGHPPEEASDTLSKAFTDRFPTIPNDEVTPGALCTNPDSIRYPEHIKYCKRNVSKSAKNQIIRNYDERFSYHIQEMDRQEFKIDHRIPLCMGGSNDTTNLWPQHRSVYKLTDFLEERLCTGMAQGSLKQVEAIEMIHEAKLDHAAIDAIKARVDAIVE